MNQKGANVTQQKNVYEALMWCFTQASDDLFLMASRLTNELQPMPIRPGTKAVFSRDKAECLPKDPKPSTSDEISIDDARGKLEIEGYTYQKQAG